MTFEQEVIERLTRVETKIDNGIARRLDTIEAWIGRRRVSLPMLVSVAAITVALATGVNILAAAVGWW